VAATAQDTIGGRPAGRERAAGGQALGGGGVREPPMHGRSAGLHSGHGVPRGPAAYSAPSRLARYASARHPVLGKILISFWLTRHTPTAHTSRADTPQHPSSTPRSFQPGRREAWRSTVLPSNACTTPAAPTRHDLKSPPDRSQGPWAGNRHYAPAHSIQCSISGSPALDLRPIPLPHVR